MASEKITALIEEVKALTVLALHNYFSEQIRIFLNIQPIFLLVIVVSIMKFQCLIPVSYTHLDVYNRQL